MSQKKFKFLNDRFKQSLAKLLLLKSLFIGICCLTNSATSYAASISSCESRGDCGHIFRKDAAPGTLGAAYWKAMQDDEPRTSDVAKNNSLVHHLIVRPLDKIWAKLTEPSPTQSQSEQRTVNRNPEFYDPNASIQAQIINQKNQESQKNQANLIGDIDKSNDSYENSDALSASRTENQQHELYAKQAVAEAKTETGAEEILNNIGSKPSEKINFNDFVTEQSTQEKM